MSDLPLPIRRQVEAVEAMYQPTPEEPETQVPEGGDAPAVETATQVEAPAPAESPAPAPVSAEQAAEPPTPTPKDSEATWEQRYRTLQGMNNRNAADFKQRLGDSQRENAELKRQLAEISKAQAQAPTPADPKDVETFGEDLVGMVQRAIETALGRTTSQLDGRFQTLEQRIDGAAHASSRTAEELFLDRLSEQVPDYEQINVDEGFLAWLGEEDDVYGVPRQDALDRAARALDVARVARVFKAYKATLTPAAPTPVSEAPVDPRAKAKAQLEKQVAPRASTPTPAGSPAAKRTYTAAEVTAFYDAARRGHYRGRDEEFMREEAAINLALAEGRITP